MRRGLVGGVTWCYIEPYLIGPGPPINPHSRAKYMHIASELCGVSAALLFV